MKKNKRGSLAYREAFLTGRLGIRSRLLLDLAALVGFIISLVWFCQIALLFNFYQADRSAQVRRAADALRQNIDHEDLENLADRISADNDICLLLTDEAGNPILSIDHVRYCLLHRMKADELKQLMDSAPEDGTGRVRTVRTSPFRNEKYEREHFSGKVPENETRSGLSMLYVQKVHFAEGGTGTLMINAMITPTSAVMATLRKQFIYIMIAVVVVTALFGYYMATGLSRPLIETNSAARELSRAAYTRPPHSGGYREIAELNETLVQAASDLNNVERLQRELMANISHDLRTPLTMIQGYAETMRDIPGEMNPENMQVIIDETNRLSSLVNEVMDYSRLRAGALELTFSVFDLAELAESICARVSAMKATEGYRILRDTEPGCYVEADRSRIEQVIYNLLGNALTYTGVDKTVRVKEERRGSRIRLSISDTGSGIDEADLPFIWDRYFRSEESHKRAVIGSGLGLNICRGILENHQVPYGVDSRREEGSTFWFELPVKETGAERTQT